MENNEELEKVYFHVYRLEEYGNLMKEGGVRLTFLVLRACSYKTKSEGRHQGNAPILFKGFISVFVFPLRQQGQRKCHDQPVRLY